MPFTKHYRNSNLTRTSLTNLITNGGASNGTTDWIHYGTYSTESVVDGWLRSTKNSLRPFWGQNTTWGIATAHKFYYSFLARGNANGDFRVGLYNTGFGLDEVAVAVLSITATSMLYSGIFTSTGTANGVFFDGLSYSSAGDYVEIDNVVIIDLTDPFGAGDEPTTTKMGADLLHYDPTNSWFDGTASVPTNYVDGILTHDEWETFNNKQSAPLEGSVVWNPSSLADGVGETSSAITVIGAALGDLVVVGPGVDTQGMMVFGWVSAADTVYIRLQNESGGTLDLASSTWNVRVFAQ